MFLEDDISGESFQNIRSRGWMDSDVGGATDLAQFLFFPEGSAQKHIVFVFMGFKPGKKPQRYPFLDWVWPESTPQGMLYEKLRKRDQLRVITCAVVGRPAPALAVAFQASLLQSKREQEFDVYFNPQTEEVVVNPAAIHDVASTIIASQNERFIVGVTMSHLARAKEPRAINIVAGSRELQQEIKGFLAGKFDCMGCSGKAGFSCGCDCGGCYCSETCARAHWPVHSKSMKR
jgi:hypothetical protein